ncbi:MAG: GNAT family N-acetyltransferase [Myxococcota bacterium]
MITFTNHTLAFDPLALTALDRLIQECFNPDPSFGLADGIASDLALKRAPAAVIAWADEEAVGFKLGHARGRGEFYSWLGGVSVGYRRRGIARLLMERQHEWCRDQGYQRVSTEALNDNQAMLILNLSCGFTIRGVRSDRRGLKVLMERDLSEAEGGRSI